MTSVVTETGCQPVMIAAGGTGGHVFPAVAMAEALHKHGITTHFITDSRGSAILGKVQDNILAIRAASPFSGSRWHRLLGSFQLMIGTIQAMLEAIRIRPAMIIGFGGYPSAPPMLAGKLLGIPLMLHEQNAHMGRANRWLGRFANGLALSWKGTRGLPENSHNCQRITGMPVRQAFHDIGSMAYQPPTAEGPVHLVIIGGSLGATIFSTALPDALIQLPETLKSRLILHQQARPESVAALRQRYAAADIKATIQPFFDDMPSILRTAQLVISRAGASMVAELVAARRPAILCPFPAAMDDHQTANARHITDAGGGWLLAEKELTATAGAQTLAKLIQQLASTPQQLTDAADNLGKLQQPDAAETLCQFAISIINRHHETGRKRLNKTAAKNSSKGVQS